MMISFFRTRPNAIPPNRAHTSDAGMDVFYCPDSTEQSEVELQPGHNFMFKTGIKMGIPHGYMVQVCNRGSMGAKKSLTVAAHIIDSGYSGEILVDLHNIGHEPQIIKSGDKIAQLVVIPVIHVIPMEAKSEESLYGMAEITMSDRGEGKLGSTNK